jgi:hypothetical protein
MVDQSNILTIQIPPDDNEQTITVGSVKKITVNYAIVIASFILLLLSCILLITKSIPSMVYIIVFILGNICILVATIRQKVSEVGLNGLMNRCIKIVIGLIYLSLVSITAISSFIIMNLFLSILFTLFQAICYVWYLKMF